MTIGVNDLKTVPKFNNASKVTGTVHVVVVSGYNISLVFGLVIAIIGSQYKMRNLLIALSATFLYALISGFEPPVIRAWVMGSIAAWGKYYGRSLDGARLLFFSGLVMILYNPEFLFSLSFQLSFMATLSLCLFSDPISVLIKRFIGKNRGFLVEDLTSTLSAQILVWPLISNYFGTVSVISPAVNPLILWTVPISTVLGMVMLLLTFISAFLSKIFIYVVFVPLDLYVQIVSWFGSLKWASVNFELSTVLLVIYYLVIFFWRLCLYRH
jgi:competence protein ComEC